MDSSLIAFALTKEYAGTVDITDDAGKPQTVPKFGGGLLAVGDGDFAVAEQLTRGDGVITVWATDSPLVEILDAYPVLERVDVPEDPHVVSPYDRVSDAALEHIAALRGVRIGDVEPGPATRAAYLAELKADDANQLAEVAQAAEAASAPAASPAAPPAHPLERMSHQQLRDVAGGHGLAKTGTSEQLIARIREHEDAQNTDDESPEG